jgi:hypothetical protein
MKYGWSRLPSTRLVGPAREPRGGTPLRGFPCMFGQLRETDAQGHTRPVSSREERMADNEAASREFNEEIEELSHGDPPSHRLGIVCECALRTCDRAIDITIAEYQLVRNDPLSSPSCRTT